MHIKNSSAKTYSSILGDLAAQTKLQESCLQTLTIDLIEGAYVGGLSAIISVSDNGHLTLNKFGSSEQIFDFYNASFLRLYRTKLVLPKSAKISQMDISKTCLEAAMCRILKQNGPQNLDRLKFLTEEIFSGAIERGVFWGALETLKEREFVEMDGNRISFC